MTPADVYRLIAKPGVGRSVTVRRKGSPDIDAEGVIAWVRSDSLTAVAGDRPMDARDVTIAAADPALASFPVPIRDGDFLVFDGAEHRVMGTGLKYMGASPARYDFTIIGPV